MSAKDASKALEWISDIEGFAEATVVILVFFYISEFNNGYIPSVTIDMDFFIGSLLIIIAIIGSTLLRQMSKVVEALVDESIKSRLDQRLE